MRVIRSLTLAPTIPILPILLACWALPAACADSGNAKPYPIEDLSWNESGTQLLVSQWGKVLLLDKQHTNITTVYSAVDHETIAKNPARACFAGAGFAVLTQQRELLLLDRHGKRVSSLPAIKGFSFDSKGEALATLDPERLITLYRLESGVPQKQAEWRISQPKLPTSYDRHPCVEMFQFTADDKLLVGSISWWAVGRSFVTSVEERKELGWHSGTLFHAIQVNYPYFATINNPNAIVVRHLRDGRELVNHPVDEKYPLRSCWVSSSADRLLTISGKIVRVVDTEDGEVVNEWKLTGTVSPMLPLSYSKKLNCIAMGTMDGKILLFDCSHLRFAKTLLCDSTGAGAVTVTQNPIPAKVMAGDAG